MDLWQILDCIPPWLALMIGIGGITLFYLLLLILHDLWNT